MQTNMGKYWILDYFPHFIYNFLLLSLHGFIYIITRLRLLKRTARELYVARGPKLGLLKEESEKTYLVAPEKLKSISSELSKRPKHLTIILMDGNDQFTEELSNVALWSICLGTPYITLYDKEGRLCRSQEELKMSIYEKLRTLLGDAMVKYSFIFKDSSSSYDNGYVNTTGICVQVICEDDCRKDIVEVSKEIADSCDAKELKIEEIDASLVNSKLKGTKGLPDPDLAIIFSKVWCLDGCLPWQLRLTEILSFESIEKITLEKFALAFRKFSRCEQRFGK